MVAIDFTEFNIVIVNAITVVKFKLPELFEDYPLSVLAKNWSDYTYKYITTILPSNINKI